MPRDFPVKEIALQAGLSVATVDRVLNRRPGVRVSTAARVEQAMRELRRQSQQIILAGRKFMIDIVMEAPDRFTTLVREALEAEMPALRPAIFRSRFHFSEVIPVRDLVVMLNTILRRGSNGVLLKAPDVPETAEAIARLAGAGIPVVTLVTDIANSRRAAYVGIDNRGAGETAAYLTGQWMGTSEGKVLVTLSSNRFRGEEEREIGFRRALRQHYPKFGIVEISEGHGRDRDTGLLVGEALARDPHIAAVYSIGGGNAAIIQAFRTAQRPCRVFIGHDLDAGNIRLLREGAIHAVLHHDLRQDLRSACQHVMIANRALPRLASRHYSPVQVITPFNIPQTETLETGLDA